MTARLTRFAWVLAGLALIELLFGEARAAGAGAELQAGDLVAFVLPGTTDRRCGRVSSFVEFAGRRYAWVEAGQLVARVALADLQRGCEP